MTNKPFNREAYTAQIRADIADQRQTLAHLVDECHEAFRQMGGTSEDYIRTQFFIGMLFRAVNALPEGTSEKRTGFKVALIFMRALKQHYIDMRNGPDGAGKNDKGNG